MHRRHDPARLVGSNGDETKIEGPAEGSDLGEGGADGKVRKFGGIVVGSRGEGGDRAVTCVSKGELGCIWKGVIRTGNIPSKVDF
jgi:hypothetical protein